MLKALIMQALGGESMESIPFSLSDGDVLREEDVKSFSFGEIFGQKLLNIFLSGERSALSLPLVFIINSLSSKSSFVGVDSVDDE